MSDRKSVPALRSSALQRIKPARHPVFGKLFFKESFCAWIFIAPALIGFAVFYLLPCIRALYISFTDWNLLRAAKFIGPANYSRLWNDPNFWNAMRVTLLYVIYNIPIQTAIGLLLAVLLSQLRRSVAIRSIILAPYLIANVIAAIIWFWMLDPLLGFGNMVLQAVGAGRIAFFSDQRLALATIAAVNIWRHMGLVAILFYTGIQTIPRDIYEAARIEGAGPWKNFWRITLPLLRPTLVFVLITSIIGSFQVFDSIAVTTLGGPVNSTRTIVWYIYERELEESALMDGASYFGIFFRIVLPVHRSALATLTILTALSAWNEFFWPFLIGRSESVRVMAVAINAFRQQQAGGTPDWSGLMACTVLGIVPIAVLVVFFGRRVVESFQYAGPR